MQQTITPLIESREHRPGSQTLIKQILITKDTILVLGWISAILVVVLALSLFSGFHSSKVPFDLAWQFSPIGLLQGIRPENLELASSSYFQGHFGWTPDYLVVFLKTCLCESPFYFWCLRKKRFLTALALLLTANLLTHPIVFFVIPTLFEKYVSAALSAEAFAPLIEMIFIGWIIKKDRGSKAALLSAMAILLANLFSWEVGMFW